MTESARKTEDSQGVKPAYKRIELREQRLNEAKKIEEEFSLSPVAARLLAARNHIPFDEIEHYLEPTLKRGLPLPTEIRNIEAACELIKETADSGKGVAICCDFDVDGLTGGSQLYHFLTAAGIAAKVFVPDRFADGYGLNEGMIHAATDAGYGLILTVDFGTTNANELALARELGLKTMVLDHHHVGEHDPGADVFVNPQHPDCGFADGLLCASGLVWYLIVMLRKTLPQAKDLDAKDYLDLACLGTICDMVPLRGANRVIAKRGLELMSRTERKGLIALKNVAGVADSVSCSHVSFGIGPRINAAGRMVHGDVVVDLLTTDSEILAERLARKLNKLNKKRQDEEEWIKDAAISKILKEETLPSGLVVWDDSYHTGVIGIVAQRLVETFYRPSVVLGADEPGVLKGSVRGIKGFNVVETLGKVGEHLIKFGGHAGAGGLSIKRENVEAFKAAFNEVCAEILEDIPTEPVSLADTKAELADLSPTLVHELRKFEPFGVGNPGPLILIENLKVTDVKVLKNAHLKVTLSDGSRSIAGLMWKRKSHPALIVGNTVKIACKPEVNTYRGNTSMQAILQAVELQ